MFTKPKAKIISSITLTLFFLMFDISSSLRISSFFVCNYIAGVLEFVASRIIFLNSTLRISIL